MRKMFVIIMRKMFVLVCMFLFSLRCSSESWTRFISKLSLNILPVTNNLPEFKNHEILRGGFDPDDNNWKHLNFNQLQLDDGRKVNLLEEAWDAFERAEGIAKFRRHAEITPAHYFLALLQPPESSIRKLLVGETTSFSDAAGAVVKGLNQVIGKIPTQSPAPSVVGVSGRLQQALARAQEASRVALLSPSTGDIPTAMGDLVIALADDPSVQTALSSANFPLKRLHQAVALRATVRQKEEPAADKEDGRQREALTLYSRELVAEAEKGRLDPVIGREEEIRRVVEILSRRTKNNPCLVGEPGVGKTAIVEGLAHRILAGDVPQGLNGTRIYSLDLAALYAGTKFHGELEERFKRVMHEVEAARGAVLLFVDELHMVVGGGGEGVHSLANLLKPALARGLRCIGATTNKEYREHIEQDGALERRFQKVVAKEPSVEDSVSILRGLRERFEAHHGVSIADAALVAAARLAHRHISGRFLPDKAIDLLDEAAAAVRVQLDSQPEALDRLARRRTRLEVEARALRREADPDPEAARRLREVEAAAAAAAARLERLQGAYEVERRRVGRLRGLRRRIEEVKQDIAALERRYNLDRVAELRYEVLPPLELELASLTAAAEPALADPAADARSADAGGSGGDSATGGDSEGGDVPVVQLAERVGPEEVARVVARWTGIPTSRVRADDRARLLGLEDRVGRAIVGQRRAVAAVCQAVLRARAGLGRRRRPCLAMLFLGPTGVGKTELCRAVAGQLFDDEERVVRVDMSEYMEQHAVARLIGAPPGYVGHEAGGQLTEAVRRQPYSLVLLDEVDKAHPLVLDVLLQVMDAGRLTDGSGRVVDFSSALVVLTSNLGAHLLAADDTSSDVPEATQAEVMAEVRARLRPEFLNRLDEVVIFHRLSPSHLQAIAGVQLAELVRPLGDRGVTVAADPAALERVVAAAYDPRYGARPVRRWLERSVGTHLARMALAGRLDRPCVVTLRVKASAPQHAPPAPHMVGVVGKVVGEEEMDAAGLELVVEAGEDAVMAPEQ